MTFDTNRAVFIEDSGYWFGCVLNRGDESVELHRMPIVYAYFGDAKRENRVLFCEHMGQTFEAKVTEFLTVNRAEELLRMKLSFTRPEHPVDLLNSAATRQLEWFFSNGLDANPAERIP